eukprot:CAMPEP_0175093684 /NCGR_PEP_ID=MMETSP0086_2-20121207/3159_1 /TAXON_ID=136419 /ORGANISM="Unknown Unknown, Strain D1" /LENGTH=312 /DNA_ID=CAMNT_0016366693 /DNA_START=48 /DNA_END=982 /DNA_ORIENTATION=-
MKEVCEGAIAIKKFIKFKQLVAAQLSTISGKPSPSGKAAQLLGTSSDAMPGQPNSTTSTTSANASDSSSSAGGVQAAVGGREPGIGATTLSTMRHFDRHKMGHMRRQQQQRDSGKAGATDRLNTSAENMAHPAQHGDKEAQGAAGERGEEWAVPPSDIYQRSCVFFVKPMLTGKVVEDRAHIKKVNTQMWRDSRNKTMLRQARSLREEYLTSASMRKSFVEIAFFDTTATAGCNWEVTSDIRFHPYENMVLAADSKDTIALWNYKGDVRGKERLNMFRNGNPAGSSISSLCVVNDLHVSLLLSSCDDGVVRL